MAHQAMSGKREPRYVVSFNGSRDFYQVPLALYEGDLLSSLVTDFYFPHDQPVFRNFADLPKLRQRYSRQLPSTKVHSTWQALHPQIAARLVHLDTLRTFERVDHALSEAALRCAEREAAHLFLYSHYAYQAFSSDRSSAMVKGLCMFHPHTDLVREILDRDYADHPECRQSHEAEHDTSNHLSRLDELRNEWRYADFIVCASSFTARSLEHAGCSPRVISVVPYGVDISRFPISESSRYRGRCRFLFVGQGVQRKGLHHLLHAWNRVGLADADLTVIATNLDPGIATLAGTNVSILFRQSSVSLLKHFNASDVFVMPSLIEGFGLVYLEALAAGCHCVGSRNTGLADLEPFFPPETHAISVVDAGDEDQLAMALETAYRMHQRREFDRARIRALAANVTWERFRSSVAEIARAHVPR